MIERTSRRGRRVDQTARRFDWRRGERGAFVKGESRARREGEEEREWGQRAYLGRAGRKAGTHDSTADVHDLVKIGFRAREDRYAVSIASSGRETQGETGARQVGTSSTGGGTYRPGVG